MTAERDNQKRGVSLAGKWQFPLLILAAALFAVGAAAYMFSKPGFNWDRAYARLAERVEHNPDGDYSAVATETRAMLQPKYTPADDRAKISRLYMLLGEIHWRVIQQSTVNTPEQWDTLKNDYLNAIAFGQDRTALIAERLAAVYLGLGELDMALRQYQQAIALDPSRELDYRRKIISIKRDLLKVDRRELFDDYQLCLGLDNIAPDQYGWAIDQTVDLLLGEGRYQEAMRLVEQQQARLLDAPYAQHLLYQRARVLKARGLGEQADNLLISLGRELADNSELYLKARLLRADLIWDENPDEAEAIFREVIDRGASLPLAPAAMVGLGRTLAHRGLYEQALSEFDNAIARLAGGEGDGGWVDTGMLSEHLSKVFDDLMDAGRSDMALRFALSQRRLQEVLSAPPRPEARMENARRIVDARMAQSEQAREEYRQALEQGASRDLLEVMLTRWKDRCEADGNDLLALAELASTINDRIYSDSLFQAAEAYIRADKKLKAVEALEEFIAGGADDPRLREARYLQGVMFKRLGRYDDAIAAFRTNLDGQSEDVRNFKAVEGMVPMALCYIAKGPEHFPQAETVLTRLTTDMEGVTPESELYLRALFALGDLYYRQAQWPQARIALDEAVRRDPGQPLPADRPDPEQLRGRYLRANRAIYLIADSYLQSAREALAAAADSDVVARQEAARQARVQLAESAKLFDQVVQRYDDLGGPLDAIDRIVLRNSSFARADAMFEMARYGRAIELYEAAVRRNRRSREALGGLTNIYNCYMELGQVDKANAAIERAARLRDVLEPQDADFMDPQVAVEQWNRWLDTVEFLTPAPAGQEAS